MLERQLHMYTILQRVLLDQAFKMQYGHKKSNQIKLHDNNAGSTGIRIIKIRPCQDCGILIINLLYKDKTVTVS